ncbi:hypothetical protein SLEP1_g18356 [Rubroshorea leprosula]|uniref:Uncharacterized protein n=1 Tax=Rubroshorea leprosula TaxID=152421 RepID=A0AAV5J8Z0_9ROSI|nr:hypothetical protein SLEP1_g18356 [Rubroshorea leprosula]
MSARRLSRLGFGWLNKRIGVTLAHFDRKLGPKPHIRHAPNSTLAWRSQRGGAIGKVNKSYVEVVKGSKIKMSRILEGDGINA